MSYQYDPDQKQVVLNDDDSAQEFPSSWVIGVCRTCGRQAVYPFCKHREMNGDWFIHVIVRGKVPESERRRQVGKHRSE